MWAGDRMAVGPRCGRSRQGVYRVESGQTFVFPAQRSRIDLLALIRREVDPKLIANGGQMWRSAILWILRTFADAS
jgi:hypothetical protein